MTKYINYSIFIVTLLVSGISFNSVSMNSNLDFAEPTENEFSSFDSDNLENTIDPFLIFIDNDSCVEGELSEGDDFIRGCAHGGPGATSCSTSGGGTSCSVSCGDGYYACCSGGLCKCAPDGPGHQM